MIMKNKNTNALLNIKTWNLHIILKKDNYLYYYLLQLTHSSMCTVTTKHCKSLRFDKILLLFLPKSPSFLNVDDSFVTSVQDVTLCSLWTHAGITSVLEHYRSLLWLKAGNMKTKKKQSNILHSFSSWWDNYIIKKNKNKNIPSTLLTGTYRWIKRRTPRQQNIVRFSKVTISS